MAKALPRNNFKVTIEQLKPGGNVCSVELELFSQRRTEELIELLQRGSYAMDTEVKVEYSKTVHLGEVHISPEMEISE